MMITELMMQHSLTGPNIKKMKTPRKNAYLGAKFFLAPCFFMLVCAIFWEQRKFSDFAQRESAVEVSSPNCPCVEYEDVIAEEGRLNKDIKLKETQKTGIKFDGTQVLYGKLRPYLHNWLNPDFTGVAVGDWWVLRPICIDKNYLYRLIQTKQFDDVANQSAGSKMPRADWNLISNTEFFVPISMEEQSKIAQAFTNLDFLMVLQQMRSAMAACQRAMTKQSGLTLLR